ncbi:hypothetical protein [Serratia marcescens]|uniref:Uncharacterized protein n=1 Tax=Serratia marcescens TaxID=615 RepID=A0ABD5BC30_SERMA|nr:hypothetical protein [Serratia marcescens]MDQ9409496.1 hypothetical protein [Serratia marcescens]MDQ9533076.1 hypothetical protein [Serratia marcescens]MDQ9544535.1 hypothetical protein [Serratia marcescens]MDQ9554118.1 hypothetical protein [Serratia marcescens]MDQ9575670.1 hypothetical protein [Serratia marcescens]
MTTIKRFTPDYKMHAVRFEAFAREAEHGEYVKFDAHQRAVSALEAERDALAVENESLFSAAGEVYAAGYNHGHLNTVDGIAYTEGVEESFAESGAQVLFESSETPATDAALAAIQAQGVDKFADDLHKTAMAMCSVKPDNTTPGAYAGLARSFAKKLREAK